MPFPVLSRSVVVRSGFAFGRLPTEARHRQMLTKYGSQEREVDQDLENGSGREPGDLQRDGKYGTRHDEPGVSERSNAR